MSIISCAFLVKAENYLRKKIYNDGTFGKISKGYLVNSCKYSGGGFYMNTSYMHEISGVAMCSALT